MPILLQQEERYQGRRARYCSIQDTGEIEVGRHGIFITKGFNRGVLLPQVADVFSEADLTK